MSKLICCECWNEIEGDSDLTCDCCLQPMCGHCYDHYVAECTNCFWKWAENEWEDYDEDDEDE